MSANNTSKIPRTGFVLLAALTLFWGVNFPAMKIVLSELTPWIFRTLCLSSGGIGLLIIGRLGGHAIRIPRSDIGPLIIAAVFNITGWHLCSAYGLMYLPAGRAVIIAYTMPLWASILGIFLLAEKLTSRRIIGLILGLTGLAILILPDFHTLRASPIGSLFILAAAWSWATGTVLIKRHNWNMSLVLVAAWMFILGGIPVFIGAAILESTESLINISLKAGLSLAYVILLPTLFCHWAFYKIVKMLPVSLASLGTLAAPALGVFTSALILDESLGWGEFTALVLVVSALAIVLIKPEGSEGT